MRLERSQVKLAAKPGVWFQRVTSMGKWANKTLALALKLIAAAIAPDGRSRQESANEKLLRMRSRDL